MIFRDDDIDFDNLPWPRFEELCYELLLKFGFHTLSWRKGGADQGRDIEAKRYVTDTVVSPYLEKWFIECKRHHKGVALDQVMEKVAWAQAERADHFLLIVSNYITTDTKNWLEKRS